MTNRPPSGVNIIAERQIGNVACVEQLTRFAVPSCLPLGLARSSRDTEQDTRSTRAKRRYPRRQLSSRPMREIAKKFRWQRWPTSWPESESNGYRGRDGRREELGRKIEERRDSLETRFECIQESVRRRNRGQRCLYVYVYI